MDVRDFCIIVFLVLCFSVRFSNSQKQSCNSNDSRALLSFSQSLDYEIIEWSTDASSGCCSWYGVVCDSPHGVLGRRVVALDLGGKNLKGSVSKSLSGLDQLRFLNLSFNSLEGAIPIGLFGLNQLQVLDLSYNNFNSLIPFIIDLPAIQVFNISNNFFRGNQPVLFGSVNLTAFVLGNNSFSGLVDLSLCNTSSHVEVLDLSLNHFYGELPVTFGNCRSLRELLLNKNNFSGSIPNQLSVVLSRLHLHENKFSGNLTARTFRNLSKLIDLDISSNGFYGIIPEMFASLRKLERFSAHSNSFIGPIPFSLSLCSALSYLNLRKNFLSGEINLNCSAMGRLSFLDLASNQFWGCLPDNLSSCTQLKIMNFDRNNLEGQIPESFAHLQSLSYFSVSNNKFRNISGALEILQNCTDLITLSIGSNSPSFEEAPPINKIRGFASLKVLSMPNTSLLGPIPPWLQNCSNLQVLDMSRNFLTGLIPAWFSTLKNLEYLDLSNNFLGGEIPINLTQLSGLMANTLKVWILLPNASILMNQRTEDLEYNQYLQLPKSLDLSNNGFTGIIWPEFGNLVQLQIFDLSWNNLSGTIPGNLSTIISLEILDFSHNSLSGTIPFSLTELTFLSSFNVAHNRLQGTIPTASQFSTFPTTSFEGNLGLCGDYWLPCTLPPQVHTPPIPLYEPEASKFHIIGLQFGLGVATGFVVTVVFCFTRGWLLAH